MAISGTRLIISRPSRSACWNFSNLMYTRLLLFSIAGTSFGEELLMAYMRQRVSAIFIVTWLWTALKQQVAAGCCIAIYKTMRILDKRQTGLNIWQHAKAWRKLNKPTVLKCSRAPRWSPFWKHLLPRASWSIANSSTVDHTALALVQLLMLFVHCLWEISGEWGFVKCDQQPAFISTGKRVWG